MVITPGKGVLDTFDIKLDVGILPVDNMKGVWEAANHLSWLDIFAMSAVYPRRFVAEK